MITEIVIVSIVCASCVAGCLICTPVGQALLSLCCFQSIRSGFDRDAISRKSEFDKEFDEHMNKFNREFDEQTNKFNREFDEQTKRMHGSTRKWAERNRSEFGHVANAT